MTGLSRPRLLVCTARHAALEREFERQLGGVPRAYLADARGPWEAVEAILTGGSVEELPETTSGNLPSLRFVQRVFTGMDGFPFARFPAGVRFAGNPGAYAPFVAEHAVALALALAKRLRPNLDLLRSGRLRPVSASRTLEGGTLLVLGFGAIGSEVAVRLRAFGMRVEGVNRDGAPRAGCDRMWSADQLRGALPGADLIVDCRPLTRRTRGSIGAAELALLKDRAMLVNVGRAATVDEAALYEFLLHNPDRQAAFDAWWSEDYAKGTAGSRFAFLDLPNFFGSPHTAGISEGARERAYHLAVENLARFFRGDPVLGEVDPSDYVGSTDAP